MTQNTGFGKVKQLKPDIEPDNLRKISQLFHLSNLEQQLDGDPEKYWKVINRKRLINSLNLINFKEETVLVNLKHRKFGKTLSLPARPSPCTGETVECLWEGSSGAPKSLKSYEFSNLLISDGQKLILVRPEVISMDKNGVTLNLPETSYEVSSRRNRRSPCQGIKAQIIQNGVIFSGSLVDFSAVSFRLKLIAKDSESFQWINPDLQVYSILKDNNDVLYSGICEIIRQTSGKRSSTFILKPKSSQITRVKSKEFRSLRQQISPSPNVIFTHPFTKKKTTLNVVDLSGSGFSVEEALDNSVLMPGMIFPEIGLEFMSSFVIKCKAQVIYRKKAKNEIVSCGLAILDMAPKDQVRLSALLNQAKDKNSYICTTNVDLDELWNFFFETGFIYPKKYSLIKNRKEQFKKTYEKLYTQNPDIAKHIIYQDKGRIFGHVSMFRFYEKTWLIHHHAAKLSRQNKAGLIVAEQLGHYINEFHRMYSHHMHYLACYFRPENRFPNRVFGGIARELDDPKRCSIDRFAYLQFNDIFPHDTLSPRWSLTEADIEDLVELEHYYEDISGGLMINGLDLEPSMLNSDTLNNEYSRLGFRRDRKLFSLKKDGRIKAILMVNISDFGLNMSDLTNCIQIIIMDQEGLDKKMLTSAVSELAEYYEHKEVPVLLHPVSYADEHSIPYDKTYNLLVLSIEHFHNYFKQVEKLFRIVK